MMRCRVIDDVIYFKNRIYLVLGSQLWEKILKETHDSPLDGYPGFLKTYKTVRDCFTWRHIKEDVLRYVHKWNTCHRNKVENTYMIGLL